MNMLRVIIADDEERVCRLIQALADWEALGMEVCGIAHNGLEAMSLVESLSPDILITDIRMPGYSGLELISRAKAVSPALEVIIISGYAQFDYAQTAIGYGVGEYLLKPINQDSLNATLAKMGRQCRARDRMETDMEALRVSSRDDRERLRANLIPDLLDGRYAAKDARQLDRTYHFGGASGVSQVFLFKMDYDLDRFQEQSLDIVRNKAEDVFRPVLAGQCADFALCRRGAVVAGVMHYPPEKRDALRGFLRDCLNQMVAMTSLFGAVTFSLALGQPARSADALPASLDSARRVLAERLTEGTERLLEGHVPPSGIQEADLLARYAQAAADAIDMLSPDAARGAADALEEAATAVPGVRGWELLQVARSAGVLFLTRLGVEEHERQAAEFQDRADQCPTARGLFDCLRAMQHAQITAALERLQSQQGQPIRQAKQYIKRHYARPLTLEEVSAAMGFSVNYFSTLFKKETGEGFAKYLTRVRMEEARSLLRETRLPVAEICRQVGYADIKHFTHTFKAAVGVTPGEFRKLYG